MDDRKPFEFSLEDFADIPHCAFSAYTKKEIADRANALLRQWIEGSQVVYRDEKNGEPAGWYPFKVSGDSHSARLIEIEKLEGE